MFSRFCTKCQMKINNTWNTRLPENSKWDRNAITFNGFVTTEMMRASWRRECHLTTNGVAHSYFVSRSVKLVLRHCFFSAIPKSGLKIRVIIIYSHCHLFFRFYSCCSLLNSATDSYQNKWNFWNTSNRSESRYQFLFCPSSSLVSVPNNKKSFNFRNKNVSSGTRFMFHIFKEVTKTVQSDGVNRLNKT